MQTPSGFAERAQKHLARRIALFTALIVALIVALLTAAILKARHDALARARLEASYLSSALEEDVEGSLNTIACASEFVKQRIEHGDGAGILQELKQHISKNSPALVAISIIGADGRLRATSDGKFFDLADFSNFSFFRTQKDSPNDSFVLGKPVTIANRPIIPATRRLETREGDFAGIVLFSIDPQIGAETFRRVNLGQSGSLKILGTNGIVFAGFTLPHGPDPSLIGTIAAADRALARWRLGMMGGYLATSPADGIERVYSWRKIAGFPLIAIVGIGKAEAMAGANREAILVTSLGALSAGLLLGMAWMLGRELSRRAKYASFLDGHRRKLQEMNVKLETAKRHAEDANRSKSLFLANISHELRTPLNAILGFAEVIRDRVLGNDPDRYSKYAADIYQAGTHLLNVVRALLDLSKIEAGKLELHEQWVKVDRLASECLLIVKGQAEKKGVSVSIPRAIPAICIFADETSLKQIIINLLSNAIKFTPEGGSVSLSGAAAYNGAFILKVEDTGIGMTEAEVREALKPYGQVRNEGSAGAEGTGLGLPLAVQLAQLHAASLTIDSHPGAGTAVVVEFPNWRTDGNEHHPAPPGNRSPLPGMRK
jgi:two-component system, cell cycle sensor histidine kinase PleC